MIGVGWRSVRRTLVGLIRPAGTEIAPTFVRGLGLFVEPSKEPLVAKLVSETRDGVEDGLRCVDSRDRRVGMESRDVVDVAAEHSVLQRARADQVVGGEQESLPGKP